MSSFNLPGHIPDHMFSASTSETLAFESSVWCLLDQQPQRPRPLLSRLGHCIFVLLSGCRGLAVDVGVFGVWVSGEGREDEKDLESGLLKWVSALEAGVMGVG